MLSSRWPRKMSRWAAFGPLALCLYLFLQLCHFAYHLQVPPWEQPHRQTHHPLRAAGRGHHQHGWHRALRGRGGHLYRSSQQLWARLWADHHDQVRTGKLASFYMDYYRTLSHVTRVSHAHIKIKCQLLVLNFTQGKCKLLTCLYCVEKSHSKKTPPICHFYLVSPLVAALAPLTLNC